MRTLLLLFMISVLTVSAQRKDINTEVLSSIISKKQDELKKRVLSDIVVKNIKPTNYYTYNTIYGLVNTITTEKNKTVMTQELLNSIIEYSIVMNIGKHFIEQNFNEFNLDFGDDNQKINSNLKNTTVVDDYYKSNIDKEDLNEDVYSFKNDNDFILFQNYIIDKIYSKLKTFPMLTNLCLFKNIDKRNYFNSGLDFDYTAIEDNEDLVLNLDERINNYLVKSTIIKIFADYSKIYELISIESLKFDDLKKLDPQILKEVISIFNDMLSDYRNKVGNNGFIATIGDLITKYIVFDIKKDTSNYVYDFEIDIDAIILELEERFYNNYNISLFRANIQDCWIGVNAFFTIGLNQSYSINDIKEYSGDIKELPRMSFAGEKIGVKFIFNDFKYTHSKEPGEWYKYKGKYYKWNNPVPKYLLNNWYIFVYGSGIIYNLTNLKTEDKFKYSLLGIGSGIELYNGLEFNLSFVIPLDGDNNFENNVKRGFVNFGFDIPIFEYIAEINSD